MFLEFSRVAMNRRDMGKARLFCDFLAIPFLVALMLTLSYLSRDTVSDHRTSFVYFSTLYAFWCGLFGSCQAFNGEVASGEWSYWVLGQRRPLLPHLLSHFAIGIMCALLQVVVCAAFVVALSLVLKNDGGTLIKKLTDMLSHDGDYGLNGYWTFLNAGATGAYYWALIKYLLMGLAAALISGTCLGLLISAVFRNPQTSLSASVCVIVACTVLSQTSLKGEGNGCSGTRDFAPASLVWRQYAQCRADKVPYARYKKKNLTFFADGGAVELASWFLPQRFFFNLGRIPFLDLNSDAFDREWCDSKTLWRHQIYRQNPEKLDGDELEEMRQKVRNRQEFASKFSMLSEFARKVSQVVNEVFPLNYESLNQNYDDKKEEIEREVWKQLESTREFQDGVLEEIRETYRGCLCPVCLGLVRVEKETAVNTRGRKVTSYNICDIRSEWTMPYTDHWIHSARNSSGAWKEVTSNGGVHFCDTVTTAEQKASNAVLIGRLFKEDGGCISSYRAFFREMAIGEFAIIGLQSLVMLVVSFFCIKGKDAFNELR